MKVVLLERVEKLGAIGDVVNVKDGFARNFLLPQSKALRATKSNLVRFEAEREFIEARNAETAAKAQISGGELDGKDFTVIRQAGETGILYGSVSSRDIAELVGGEVKKSMVALEQPIKNLGTHTVRVKLHPEVSINVVINVARTEDEAIRQLAGEDVIKTQMDDDRATASEQNSERADASEMFEGDYENQLDGIDEASDEASDETSGETKAKSDNEEE